MLRDVKSKLIYKKAKFTMEPYPALQISTFQLRLTLKSFQDYNLDSTTERLTEYKNIRC